MSAAVETHMQMDGARPVRRGSRSHPKDRTTELRRPSAVYMTALQVSLARMVVIDRLRDEGFGRS